MERMGSHSHPNGHRGEDGATALIAPPVLQVPQLGPMSPWPPQADAATSQDPPAAAAEAGRKPLDSDTTTRLLTAGVVLAVALIAAVVSYSHIFTLGRLHGQDGVAARMLPLSVDGLIAAASLVMLHAARKQLPVPFLSRAMLALGVGATVAANVGYGLPFGWLSAVVSAWPAVAFVGSVEMAVRFVRDARTAATGAVPDGGSNDGTEATAGPSLVPSESPSGDRREPVTATVTPAPPAPSPRPSRQPSKRMSGRDRAAAIIKKDATLTDAEVAKRARVSESTARRARTASA
jgi:Protein of unknown function (DUF2637)